MNRIALIAFATLGTLSIARAQSDSPKVTYSTVAIPVSRALDEISKQAGYRLSASPQVAGEVVILSLRDVPLDDVKTQIAKACSARWEAVQGGEMLVADVVLRRQEEQKERAEYAEALAKSLKQLTDALNPPKAQPGAKPDPAANRQFPMFGGMGASGKAVIQLAQTIGANTLATIEPKSRVVFSTTPTRMQRPFPRQIGGILSVLVTEYNKEAAVKQKVRAENPREEDPREKAMRQFFGMDEEDKVIEGVPTKAILICTREQMMGGLSLNLKVYNDQGKVVISGNQMLMAGESLFGGAMDFEFGPDGLPKPKPAATAPAGEKAIEFSANVKELMSMSNIATMSSSPAKMGEELKMKLLQPDQYDPLSFMHSEALLATAKQRGKNLVAVLPDKMDSFMGMMMPKSDGLTPTAYLDSIKSVVTVSADSPVILVRPLKPAKSRRERIDRLALGKFLRAVDAKGSVTLDDLAEYAQHSNSPMEDTSAMMYFMIFAPNAVQSGMGGMVNWEMLRFYGASPMAQRQNLANGGRVPFGQLNPAQSAAVRQMLFGPDTGLTSENPNREKPVFELPSFVRNAIMRELGGDFRSEPTEIMPNGLPPQGFVQLNLVQDNIVKPTGNVPAMFGNAALGADELAMLKMFKEMPGMEQVATMMPNIEEVRIGERSVYEFRFTVAPGVYQEESLNDDRINSKSPVVKMANLPAAFAKRIDDRLAAFKKLPFFDPAFMNPQRGTPPPLN